jgi:phosphoheptose isomerase
MTATTGNLQRIVDHLLDSANVQRETAAKCAESIAKAADLIAGSFRSGGKLLLCGNGGSAADCQHMAAEFVSRLSKNFERRALPAIALTTDTSFLTGFSNDCGFEEVFARQIEALGCVGDVLVGISTSGNSLNVIRAVETAKSKDMRTIALTGNTGRLPAIADVAITVPSSATQYIQETHLAVEHIVCELVEDFLFL